jgi:hypothetical protein
MVAWASDGQDGDGLGIYAQQFSADGAPSDSELHVSTTTAADQAIPAAAMSGGRFAITWQGKGRGDDTGIFAQAYLANTAPVAANTAPVVAFPPGTLAYAEGSGPRSWTPGRRWQTLTRSTSRAAI